MVEQPTPLRRHVRSAVVNGGGLLREAATGIREGLQQLQDDPGISRRQSALEWELEEARRQGRWLSDDERLELEAERQRLHLATEAQRRRRRSLITLLVVSVLLPPLWPLAPVLAAYLLFPRTTGRVLLGALTLAGLAVVLLIALVVTLLVVLL
jgi:hypothetical protein